MSCKLANQALGESGGDLANDVGGGGGFETAAAAGQHLLEILPRDIFLGNEVGPIDAADFVNLHDIGVDEFGGRLRFVTPALDFGYIASAASCNDFNIASALGDIW